MQTETEEFIVPDGHIFIVETKRGDRFEWPAGTKIGASGPLATFAPQSGNALGIPNDTIAKTSLLRSPPIDELVGKYVSVSGERYAGKFGVVSHAVPVEASAVIGCDADENQVEIVYVVDIIIKDPFDGHLSVKSIVRTKGQLTVISG